MTRNIALAVEIAVGAAAIAAAAAITTNKAHADDITVEDSPFVSTRSRAEVQAELTKYGDITEWTLQLNDPQFNGSYTSGQARAGYLAARDEVRALTGEDSGSVYLGKRPVDANNRAIMGAPAAKRTD
jgi:hypothetical protein